MSAVRPAARRLARWRLPAAAIVAGCAVAVPGVSIADQSPGPAVMVGVDGPYFDACGAIGHVTGLNPNGDNFLAVRAGPSAEWAKLDELQSNDQLHICEQRGRWLGVVYDPSGRGMPCGVDSPVSSPRPYRGDCRAGWVYDRYVQVDAG